MPHKAPKPYMACVPQGLSTLQLNYVTDI